MSAPNAGKPDDVTVDTLERGANGQTSSRRLFMQRQAFGGCGDARALAASLERSQVEAVLYADLHDARGVGVLTLAEDPAFFTTRLREVLGAEPWGGLTRKPELAMFGRTYSSGFEAHLEDWLLGRPRRTVLNPAWPWPLWYPLRGPGAFAQLAAPAQAR